MLIKALLPGSAFFHGLEGLYVFPLHILLPSRLFVMKEGEFMGRPRKIKSVKALEEAWEEYKEECDNQTVLTHEFSAKNSEFVSKELKRSITYTIEGFCVFIGITRSTFYKTYGEDEKFSDTVTRMKEECELDARKKFELQIIPSQLAGLWMSNYGYTTKSEGNVEVKSSVTIVDDLDE